MKKLVVAAALASVSLTGCVSLNPAKLNDAQLCYALGQQKLIETQRAIIQELDYRGLNAFVESDCHTLYLAGKKGHLRDSQ